jgi:hypothetical protein
VYFFYEVDMSAINNIGADSVPVFIAASKDYKIDGFDIRIARDGNQYATKTIPSDGKSYVLKVPLKGCKNQDSIQKRLASFNDAKIKATVSLAVNLGLGEKGVKSIGFHENEQGGLEKAVKNMDGKKTEVIDKQYFEDKINNFKANIGQKGSQEGLDKIEKLKYAYLKIVQTWKDSQAPREESLPARNDEVFEVLRSNRPTSTSSAPVKKSTATPTKARGFSAPPNFAGKSKVASLGNGAMLDLPATSASNTAQASEEVKEQEHNPLLNVEFDVTPQQESTSNTTTTGAKDATDTTNPVLIQPNNPPGSAPASSTSTTGESEPSSTTTDNTKSSAQTDSDKSDVLAGKKPTEPKKSSIKKAGSQAEKKAVKFNEEVEERKAVNQNKNRRRPLKAFGNADSPQHLEAISRSENIARVKGAFSSAMNELEDKQNPKARVQFAFDVVVNKNNELYPVLVFSEPKKGIDHTIYDIVYSSEGVRFTTDDSPPKSQLIKYDDNFQNHLENFINSNVSSLERDHPL